MAVTQWEREVIDALWQDWKKRPQDPRAFFVNTDAMDIMWPFGHCARCQAAARQLGGLPFDETGYSPLANFAQALVHGFTPDTTTVSQETPVVVLEPRDREPPRGDSYIHWEDVVKIVDVNLVRAKFFAGRPLTFGLLENFQSGLRAWFESNGPKWASFLPLVSRPDIRAAVDRAFQDLRLLQSLHPLKALMWVLRRFPAACSVIKLKGVEDVGSSSALRDAELKFDPLTLNLNQQEKKKELTHDSLVVYLEWEAEGFDFDASAKPLLEAEDKKKEPGEPVTADDEKDDDPGLRVFFGNRGNKFLSLDCDNMKGGPGSKEIITGDVREMLAAGFKAVKFWVINYWCPPDKAKAPFRVVVNQHGDIRRFEGTWQRAQNPVMRSSNPKDACFVCTILLEPPPPDKGVDCFSLPPLPAGIKFVTDTVDVPSEPCARGYVEHGRGGDLVAFLTFDREKMPFLKGPLIKLSLGGRQGVKQNTSSFSYDQVYTVGGTKFVHVGHVPLECKKVMFTKEMFEFGAQQRWRGQQFCPYIFDEARAQCLRDLGLPAVLTNLVMAFATDEIKVPCFTAVV